MKHLIYLIFMILPTMGFSQNTVPDDSTNTLVEVYQYYKNKHYVEIMYRGEISIGEIIEIRSNPNCPDKFYDMTIKLKGGKSYGIGYVHYQKIEGNVTDKLINGENYNIHKKRKKLLLYHKTSNNNLGKIYLELKDKGLVLIEIKK